MNQTLEARLHARRAQGAGPENTYTVVEAGPQRRLLPRGELRVQRYAKPGTRHVGMSFGEAVEYVGKAVDAAGVAAIVIGIAYATLLLARQPRGGLDTYRSYRQALGRGILLGLEILVAADIIRTVAVSPTFRSVRVLAVIVLVRTFLSFSLEVELDGRWPWQRKQATPTQQHD